MNVSCEFCKRIRDAGGTTLCRVCWRILNKNRKPVKGKNR